MLSKQILPALAAVGVSVVAAASNNGCAPATATVNSAADATNLASACSGQDIPGSVVIGNATGKGSIIDLTGPTGINGDLICENNGQMVTLQSTSIGHINGAFTLHNVTFVSTLGFSGLHTVGSISWRTLTSLQELAFGTPGVTQAKDVEISDTVLVNLDGIDLTSVGKLDINNNHYLTEFSSQLGNLTDNLNINANGQNLKVSMPKLIWIANATISNVSDFSVPSLQVVNGSVRFDSNYFTNFTAPNMTSTGSGDISFISNGNLAGLAFPSLTKTGGSITIANNTGLEQLDKDSFPKLKNVGGAIKLRGSFSDVEFPALSSVKGAFDVSSTKDISKSCSNFDKLQPNGGSGVIQGLYSCQSNNSQANQDTSTDTNGGGSSSGNAASGLGFSLTSVFTLAAVGLVVQALL